MTITDTATTQVGRPDDDPARFSESDDVDVLFEEFLTTRGPDRDLAYLAVEQHIRRLRALQARMLSEVRRSCTYLDDTHHTPANWVQAVTNSSIATARQITNTAALFEQLPALATTYATGHIGTEQINILVKLNLNPVCHEQLPDSEQLLTSCALTLTHRDFRTTCRRWQDYADPDGTNHDHDASRTNRHATTSNVGTGHILYAEGDAITGEIITTILNEHTQAEYHRDITDRADRYGDQAAKHPLARTTRQRRYDALTNIFLKATNTTDTGSSTTTRTPLVNLICTPDILLQAIYDLLHETSTDPDTGQPAPGRQSTHGRPASGTPNAAHIQALLHLLSNHQSHDNRADDANRPDEDTTNDAGPGDYPANKNLQSNHADSSHVEPKANPPDTAPPDTAPPGAPPPSDGLGSADGLMYSHRFRICETTTGAPVNPRDLAIAALTGHIRRITIDATGRITNLGRRQRLFTGAARETILLMGPHCTYPGCNRTIGLHIDHLQEWTRNNGTTDITNGGPTCPQHNNAKHTNTTTDTRDETGWHHHRADSTEIAPRWSG